VRPRYYCTYFDRNFLSRALALHESLRRHAGEFIFDVLCLDAETENLLKSLAPAGIRTFSLAELEAADPALVEAKGNRSWVEFIWTLTPSLIQRCLHRNPAADMVTYLDADLYFYSSPEPIFAEMADASVSVIPHRFATNVAAQEAYSGIFNVGLMSFRRDERAAAVLAWWRQQCLAACHATAKDGKFGDQKYLDDWPERFPGVAVISHPGANLAPWNIRGHRLERTREAITVDGRPLVFYHFHRLDILNERWFRCGVGSVNRRDVDLVYRDYLAALRRAYARIRAVASGFSAGIGPVTPGTVWRWIRYRRLHFIYQP
jgi:hypothetical protein